MRFPGLRLELVVYVLIALLAIAPALQAGHVVGDGVDAYGTVWFYWWIQHCMTTGTDPSFTDFFFYPLGKDIFAHTGNNFVDALAAAPLYWIVGNPGYQRWFVLLLLVANALSFRVLARGLFASRWAAFLATLAWMVNPYVIFEITCGRLTQAFLVFLPLALHFFLKMETDSCWRKPLLCGLFVALQAWTYWFMGWFIAFLFAGVALHALLKSEQRGKLALRYAAAAGACGLLVLPAAIKMAGLASDGAVPGLSDGAADLFALPPVLSNNVSSNLHGLLLAELQGAPLLSSFMWAPLVVVWVAVGRDRWRWLPAFALIALLALGPVYDGPGASQPVVLPWYMALYHHLPAFDRLWFPYRMASVLFLVVCVGIGGLAQQATDRGWGRWVPLACLLFPAFTLMEQSRYGVFPFVTRDASLPATFEVVAREKGGVVHLPFGISQPAIIWQTMHEQKLFGGMGENARLLWPEGFKNRIRNSFVMALLEVTRTRGEVQTYSQGQRERFEGEGFRWVVLHRDLAEVDVTQWSREPLSDAAREEAVLDITRALVEMLGEPVMVEGEYVLWDLTSTLPATTDALYTPTWPKHEGTAYEEALKARGRLAE